ncbi:MAG TPA: MFS transporter [Armatimonadetes bacterium]|nr:MFS transporter [Armatimonadota bacterium]
MIEVRDLVKTYGNRVAVDSISFDVAKGEILGFLGPNGAGKTTTMRVLTCFLPATSGQASVAGYDIYEQSLEVRRHIGYLPENVPLYLDLSVIDYLRYMGSLKGLSRAELPARLDYVFEACGLGHRRNDIVGHLSRGYRQRVGLAQALIHGPEVLVLDEPTASLDPVQIREVRETIRALAGEHTIILSTHILPEVELTCDGVLMINHGRIIADDTPAGLRSRAGERGLSLGLTARGPREGLLSALRAVPGVSGVSVAGGTEAEGYELQVNAKSDLREDLAKAVVQGGYGLLMLGQVQRSLEDIFVELTAVDPIHEAAEHPAPAREAEEVV